MVQNTPETHLVLAVSQKQTPGTHNALLRKSSHERELSLKVKKDEENNHTSQTQSARELADAGAATRPVVGKEGADIILRHWGMRTHVILDFGAYRVH
jgi:hypothetical protein